MAAIYLATPPLLLSSYANTVHSCGSFTVQGKCRVELGVGLKGGVRVKKRGGRGEREP